MKAFHLLACSFLALPLTGCMPSDCSSLAQSVMKKSYENAVANDEYLRRVFIAESNEKLPRNTYYGEPPKYKLSFYIDGEGNITKELWTGEVRNVHWSAQALGTSPFIYSKTTDASYISDQNQLDMTYFKPKIKSSSGISCDVPIQRSTYTDSDFAVPGTISQDNQNWSYQ